MPAMVSRIFALLFSLLFVIPAFAEKQGLEGDTRMLVNLLDYIGKDYVMAIEDGKVINDFEYEEMKEFSERSREYFQTIRAGVDLENPEELDSLLVVLDSTIQRKGALEDVRFLTSEVKKGILRADILKVMPSDWPNQKEGRNIFVQNCATCHGENGGGDGPGAAALEPPPTNFLSKDVKDNISPFQAFNTTRLGIEGTSMRAYDELTDEEVWEVAFYINSLYYRDAAKDTLKGNVGPVSLEDAAKLNDEELKNNYEGKKGFDLAQVRSYQGGGEKEGNEAIGVAREHLDKALMLYEQGKKNEASSTALDAYLQGVEPIENKVRASDPGLVGKLENKMMAVRTAIGNGVSKEKLAEHVKAANLVLDESEELLSEQEYSFWFSGIIAGSIFLREGLEALLVIIAILGVLRSLNAQRAYRWVHGGWLIAVGVGVLSWFFTDSLIAMGVKSIEMMEGVGALIAVVMLLYIGFWMHRKTEVGRWKAFIEDKIKKVLKTNNLFGLGVISFIVVFREAFETVLFLSSLKLEVAESAQAGIWVGSSIAVGLILIIAWSLLKFSKKLPIRTLFLYSSIIMALLAVVLAGKGIHAVQESGLIGVTPMPFDFRLSLLGVYPTVETFVAQFFVIAIVIVLWKISSRPSSGERAST